MDYYSIDIIDIIDFILMNRILLEGFGSITGGGGGIRTLGTLSHTAH